VDPIAGLDAVVRRKASQLLPGSNAGHPARNLVTILTELPRIIIIIIIIIIAVISFTGGMEGGV